MQITLECTKLLQCADSLVAALETVSIGMIVLSCILRDVRYLKEISYEKILWFLVPLRQNGIISCVNLLL